MHSDYFDPGHVDATLIRADVSWDSITIRHADQVMAENRDGNDDPDDSPPRHGRPRSKEKARKVSTTDPDAALTASSHDFHMEPSFKQHTAVDDACGIIVDVTTTTGHASEDQQLMRQIDRIEANTQVRVKTLTADSGYAHGRNYAALEARRIDAIIPPQVDFKNPKRIPARRFKYDGLHKLVRCPVGKILRCSSQKGEGCIYCAKAKDCRACHLRDRCFDSIAKSQ